MDERVSSYVIIFLSTYQHTTTFSKKLTQNYTLAFNVLACLTPGEVTTLSSWEPRANKKNLLFLSCITKMGQNFINFFHE